VLRLVERLGAETFLHIAPDGGPAKALPGSGTPGSGAPISGTKALLVMRLLGGHAPEPETPVEVTFDPRAAHYFALATGERLG
jgi:hypothetical protein